MKELFAQEAYRSVVTQVLPGIVGSGPWIIALYDKSPGTRAFLSQSTPVATASLFLAAVFWGFVCEDFGSRLEVWIDRWQTRADTLHAQRVWYNYLRRVYTIEPPGIRYMRTLVTRMKFELNSGIALFVASIGLNFASISFIRPLSLEVAMWVVAAYLLIEGYSSVKLLRDLRSGMQQRIDFIAPGR